MKVAPTKAFRAKSQPPASTLTTPATLIGSIEGRFSDEELVLEERIGSRETYSPT